LIGLGADSFLDATLNAARFCGSRDSVSFQRSHQVADSLTVTVTGRRRLHDSTTLESIWFGDLHHRGAESLLRIELDDWKRMIS
jgi:hypothetical protein